MAPNPEDNLRVPEPNPTVAQAMRPRLPSCTLRTPVMEVARKMQEDGVEHVVVASAGSDLIAGSVSELDLLRAVIEGKTEAMASDVMTMEPPATISAQERLAAAVARMDAEGIDFFVVIDGSPSRPVGLLSHGELAAYLARG
jgi:CBS domain-containing protein